MYIPRVSLHSIHTLYYTLLGLGILTSLTQCSPALLNETAVRGSENLLQGHSWTPRAPYVKQEWFNIRWQDTGRGPVWTGTVPCDSLKAEDLAAFGRLKVKQAYESLLSDIAMRNLAARYQHNVVACICVSGRYCWLASIPQRTNEAVAYVIETLQFEEKFVSIFGPVTIARQYHAEDLALALADHDQVRYPYVNNGVKACLSVYGLLTPAAAPAPPFTDRYGPAGIRWPCRSGVQASRPLCVKLMEKLDIDFTWAPGARRT